MDELVQRVGDAERWAVDARLQQAVGDGMITLAEYEQRAGQVWAATTRGDLDLVVRDLPAPAPVPAPAPAGPVRPRRTLALMGGDELRGPVAPGQGLEAYAVMGGALVDLRRDDLPAEVRVRAVAVMGGIEVLVPRGVEVHLSGLSVMGGRELRLDAPRPGAPVVHVDAYAVMGGVEVKHGKESERVDAVPVPHPRSSSVPLSKSGPRAPGAAGARAPALARTRPGRRPAARGRRAAGGGLDAGRRVGLRVPGRARGRRGPRRRGAVRLGDRGRGRTRRQPRARACSAAPTAGAAPAATPGRGCAATGAFGSVEVVTEAEYEAERAADRDD